jgi:hypothetical protein|tara:strand:- start:1233 stop:1628 length:396 start_codon:yes stop_codon:yes gene_type:complete
MKKNKTINWPDSTFTIDDVHKLNPDFVNITLRVRIKDAVDKYDIEEIGSIPNGKGRPKKLFVVAPVKQHHLDEAKEKNANINSHINITVASVDDTINKSVVLKNNNEYIPKPSNKSSLFHKNVIDVLDGKF